MITDSKKVEMKKAGGEVSETILADLKALLLNMPLRRPDHDLAVLAYAVCFYAQKVGVSQESVQEYVGRVYVDLLDWTSKSAN